MGAEVTVTQGSSQNAVSMYFWRDQVPDKQVSVLQSESLRQDSQEEGGKVGLRNRGRGCPLEKGERKGDSWGEENRNDTV